MIRPLRRAHRAAFAALALALPALLVAALRARREPLAVPPLPEELLPAPPRATSAADELVYWSASPWSASEPAAGRLPGDARLVGSVRSGALARVPPAGTRVLVYDLAHGRVASGDGE